MTIDRHTMTTADVARALGLSVERVRQLDEQLRPVRREGTQHRRYDPARVQKLADQRDSR
jgi:DNA-binding transcriptional MerR regulator